VEVALVQGLASAVQPLLSRDDPPGDPAKADTAIFYSISNCQEGLRGISFGNFLIKQVVEELKAELPQLTTFSTLSPVPGFRRWLERQLGGAGADVNARDTAVFCESDAGRLIACVFHTMTGATDAFRALTKDGEWWRDLARAEALREPLLRLCAEYLTRSNKGVGGIDPVARFHLGNGARLERINWLGNTSPRGMKESFGVMVNYLYDPDTIEANHEVFVHSGTVARSAQVDGLLSLPAPQREPPPSKLRLPRIRSS